jgi:ABC-type nitrate/sulfonate/bicarbonate transport system substrate-binding protein
VELVREVGWAMVREKIVLGQLDAAHALAAMPFAATLGIGAVATPCVTGLVLNLQGNAITLAQTFWKAGGRDAQTFGAEIRRRNHREPLVFGIVSPVSSHRHLLELWLRSAGLQPETDYRLAVVPPPQMPAHLKAGHLAGFCVGEPWNSVAIEAGLGWCPATSAELAPEHPEKVLMVRQRFATGQREEHLRLIAALRDACACCADSETHDELAVLLAGRHFVNAPAALIRHSLSGTFFSTPGTPTSPAPLTVFHGGDTNIPTIARGAWVLRHLIPRAAQLPAGEFNALVRQVFRPSLFESAQKFTPHPLELHENESAYQTSCVPV